MAKVIIGQEEVLEQLMTALFARGHCLMVGVPGLAKTLMVRTIARALRLDFKRIQFTPDLMPSDITGTEILQDDPGGGGRRFQFVKGPVFTNILLADEINRTPPKTQAALLEAMQEHRVTAAGRDYPLPPPFFVLATQNPIEQEGTYPLPEAQQDRFMFLVYVDYPSREEEVAIVKATTLDEEGQPEAVFSAEEILSLQSMVRKMPVSDYVVEYATDLVRSSRPQVQRAGETRAAEKVPGFIQEWVKWGAGPRASQYLILGAKARAVLQGRFNVSTRDVRAVAPPVLRHRIFTNFHAESEGIGAEQVIARLLEEVPEPREEKY
ncbi:MAG: MoxR family ATPase [Planctomycetes bacterium]|nr:MoxR family ATPase [Planctomycetota bacterium]